MKRTIKLYGYVGEYEEVSVRAIQAALDRESTPYDELVFQVHCPGGYVFEGWAIYNTINRLRNGGVKVKMEIDGVAASMGSFLLTSADEVYMAENSLLMIHAASGGAWGQAKDLQSGADMLTKITNLSFLAYKARSKASDDVVQDWLSKDTWFTPQEALAAGLIDGIIPAVMTSKPAELGNPKQVYQAYQAIMHASTNQSQLKTTNTTGMKVINTLLGLEENASEQVALKSIKTLQEQAEQVQRLQNEVADMKKKQAETEAKHQSERAQALVDGAIASNRIPKGHRERYLKLATADFQTTKELIESQEQFVPVTPQLTDDSQEALVAEYEKRFKAGTLAALKQSNPARFDAIMAAKKAAR